MRVVSWIVLIAWIMTLFRTVINLLVIKRLPAGAPDDGPRVSVIIPARDEERTIERTLRALFAQTYRNLEVIVVDDRSTDETSAILGRLAASDSRLRVIRGDEPPPGWLGKPWALHQGSRAATGAILLFIDADIIYAPRTISAAIAAFRAAGVPMIALMPKVEMVGFWENVAMPQLGFFLFSVMPLWLSNRSRTPLLAIGGGTGNMIGRADYDAIGGHEALRTAVVDDVGLAHHVRRSGHRTLTYLADDLISVRIYHGGREIIHGFTKNSFVILQRSYLITIGAVILSVVLHVCPYIAACTGDWRAIATVVIITITRLLLFRALRYPLWYAVWAHPLMVLFWTIILVRSAWVTGVRKQLHWRGRVYDAEQTRFGAER